MASKNNSVDEEAVEVATQWAQEKLDHFLGDIANSEENPKLFKIGQIVSRRTSVDTFMGKSSDIGEFAQKIVNKLVNGKNADGSEGNRLDVLGDIVGTVINKFFGAAAGSSQTERIYEVMFDELGGLYRLDAFFFCYRFSTSGTENFNKATIGSCIVRSVIETTNDNAFRVILAAGATLREEQRMAIGAKLIEVAGMLDPLSQMSLVTDGKPLTGLVGISKARAELAQAIGHGVANATSRTLERGQSPFAAPKRSDLGAAEEQARRSAASASTIVMKPDDPKKTTIEISATAVPAPIAAAEGAKEEEGGA